MDSLMNFMLANRLLSVEKCPVPTQQNLIDCGEAIIRLESRYQANEKTFYNDNGKNNKIAIDFNQYVSDPLAAISRVYNVLNDEDGTVPEEIKNAIDDGREEHKARKKTKYFIKCSLGEFGVDESKTEELNTTVLSNGKIVMKGR